MVVDAMLGKLARWLRLLGYDAVYSQAEDAELAHMARAEGRILLTRDRELAKRRGLTTVLVASMVLDEQLAQVVDAVGRLPEGVGPRCMDCNAALEAISAAEAEGSVPPYVLETVGATAERPFQRCPDCGRITWRGTHWRGIEARLRGAGVGRHRWLTKEAPKL